MKLTIGEKIALLRKKRNVTQTELAEYLYLTPQTVSRIEGEYQILPCFGEDIRRLKKERR